MNFKQFPLIHEILVEENLKPVDVLDDKLVCVDESGSKYVFKECRGVEDLVFTKVFSKIQSLNLSFSTLELPKHKKIIKKIVGEEPNQQELKFILINFYEGKLYNKFWNEYYPESLGGRGVEEDFATKSVELLKDFSLVDAQELSEFNLLTFNIETWKTQNLPLMVQGLLQKKILSEKQVEKINNILSSDGLFAHSKKILTNGDFYPRNFIELANGKIVVIDWEGRIDYEQSIKVGENNEVFKGQRNAFINYVENHVAFLYVHMWGNYTFRRSFLNKASQSFDLLSSDLQAALIIKAMEQSYLWKDAQFSHLAVDQAQILIDSLDIKYVKDMIS